MGQAKHYDREYKEEAIKLSEEKGCKKASEELGISYYTLYDWIKQARQGNLHLEKRSDSNVSKLEEELQQLREPIKNRQRKSSGLKKKTNFLRRRQLFSQRAVRSLQKRKNEIHSSENQRRNRARKNFFLLQSA